MQHDPDTPVSMLGLSPAEAKRERQRRSRAAQARLWASAPQPSLEDRVAFLELLVAELQASLNEHNRD
jgi:hypothetical protein